jgi:hypothetical protein
MTLLRKFDSVRIKSSTTTILGSSAFAGALFQRLGKDTLGSLLKLAYELIDFFEGAVHRI